jgi:hypothetical protein
MKPYIRIPFSSWRRETKGKRRLYKKMKWNDFGKTPGSASLPSSPVVASRKREEMLLVRPMTVV